jgi:hypothetical protein
MVYDKTPITQYILPISEPSSKFIELKQSHSLPVNTINECDLQHKTGQVFLPVGLLVEDCRTTDDVPALLLLMGCHICVPAPVHAPKTRVTYYGDMTRG